MRSRSVCAMPPAINIFLIDRSLVASQLIHPPYFYRSQVDFGAEYDGLIAIADKPDGDEWLDVPTFFEVGMELEVRVVRVLRDTKVFRFPVQLVPADARLASRLPPPEAHAPPMDLRHPRSTSEWQALFRAAGRDCEPERFALASAADIWQEERGALQGDRAKKARRRRARPISAGEAECDALAVGLLADE